MDRINVTPVTLVEIFSSDFFEMVPILRNNVVCVNANICKSSSANRGGWEWRRNLGTEVWMFLKTPVEPAFYAVFQVTEESWCDCLETAFPWAR